MRVTKGKTSDAGRRARGGFIAVVSWSLLLLGTALLPQSAPQAQSSPAESRFCYPAGTAQCHDAQSKAEAALRGEPLLTGRVVHWRREEALFTSSVYGRRQFVYSIPDHAAEPLYAPSYLIAQRDGWQGALPPCTVTADSYYPGWCADEGGIVGAMMGGYRTWRPDCTLSDPVALNDWEAAYDYVSGFTTATNGRHGEVGYGRKVYRTTMTCPGSSGGASTNTVLEFVLRKRASFSCPADSVGRNDSANSGYGDGKDDIELPMLCRNARKRYIDGPMLQVASCPANGNPCYPATGDKARFETDFEFAGRSFTRIYHSLDQLSAGRGMAPGWTHSFLERIDGPTSGTPTLVGASGHYETFVAIGNGRYRAENSGDRILEQVDNAFPVWLRLREPDGQVREFDVVGRLIAWRHPDQPLRDLTFTYINTQSTTQGALAAIGWLDTVTDAQGRQLGFDYDRNGLLWRIVKPDGSAVTYGYDAIGNLVSADYGAGHVKRYHYAESGLIGDASQRHHLTGITAESGQRYASFSYDAQGRVVESRVHGMPNEVTSVTYTGENEATVTTANGLERVYSFQPGLYRRITGIEEDTESRSREYEPTTGRLIRSTDRRGVVTEYEYAAGYRSATIEAVGTPQQRRQELDRDPATQHVLEMRTRDAADALVARTTMAYNSRGQVTSVTAHDPATGATRTATTTYCEQVDVTAGTCPLVGLVKALDGPRSDVADVVNFTYRQTDHPDCAAAPTTCAWRKGDLWKTTNALGHVTEVLAYDGAGRVTSIKDAHGTVTALEYDARGWLTRRTQFGAFPEIVFDEAATTIQYTADGLVRKLTERDNSFTLFGYDAGQRLTTVADSDGNAIVYTLNAAGERIAERTYDPTGALTRELSLTFDTLGRLASLTDADGASAVFAYDEEGNLVGSTDPLLRATGSAYDALGRLAAQIGNAGAPAGAADRPQTGYSYDALDRLTRVTDPKGLHTDYTYNAFGERTQLSSPDSGVTTYVFDAAGNQVASTDARGVTTNVAYDALGRATAVTYPSDSAQDVGFVYDIASGDCGAGETYLTGRLARMTDASGSTTWCHDIYGQLTRKVQRTDNRAYGLQYLWAEPRDPGQDYIPVPRPGRGKFHGWRYPDGAEVRVLQDIEGRVSRLTVVTADGRKQTLLSEARYHPFGAAAGWEWGNGLSHRRTVDRNYRPGIIQTGTQSGTQLVANPTSLSLGYEFDAAGNLIALRDGNQGEPALRTYGYDGVDRLTAVRSGGTGQLLQGYAYDATGNRQSRTDGSATTAYAYPGSSHRLNAVGAQSRGYDAVGNTLSIGGGASGGPGACLPELGCETPPPPQPDPPGFDPPPGDPSYTSQSQGGTASSTGTGTTAPALREFVYNAANRMSEVCHDGATAMQYRYNGLGEQVLKFNASRRTVTVYDESGRWIGDYDSATGNPIQQVIWLHDLPVGLLVGSGASQTLYYIEPDMLGTPRVVLNPTTNQAVWRWDLTGEAFGDTAPNQDPDGDGQAFVFDMRFPGQRFDAATGLNYNYFRDYEAGTGRYSQSDPIGLDGGISTFGYVGGNPLVYSDPLGLVNLDIPGVPISIHANPGPNATTNRPEHGPAHVHLGSNDGPRVSLLNFKPYSEEDAIKLRNRPDLLQACSRLTNAQKNLIRRRAKAVFKRGWFAMMVNGRLVHSQTGEFLGEVGKTLRGVIAMRAEWDANGGSGGYYCEAVADDVICPVQ